MWYDLDTSGNHKTWEEALHHLKTETNNNKNAISSHIKSYGLMKVADLVVEKLVVSVHEAWDIYAKNCGSEYSDLKCTPPSYVYKSTDARDLFLCNLPLIVVYKPSKFGPQAHLTKRLAGVEWGRFIGELEWPSKDKLVKEEIMKLVQHVIKPALSFATTQNDRQLLKFVLTIITSASYLSKHSELNLTRGHCSTTLSKPQQK
ncbi:hypothetical protein ACJMK2_039163 [Sinanodonta woodiana]|uniref:Uncharacterized protein n=1 Tax=Sinanodonta woodiana TaxID=1069815 RepID=A0ABD3WB51_SINWO